MDSSNILTNNGHIILTFRDYSSELKGDSRFIPVKSDDNRILTCILDYGQSFLNVTDLLYEKSKNGWEQKISSYKKVRITPNEVVGFLENAHLEIIFNEPINRMTTIIGKKK